MAKLPQTLYATIKCRPKVPKILTTRQKVGIQIIKFGCIFLNRTIKIEISTEEKKKSRVKKKKDVAPTFMPKDLIY